MGKEPINAAPVPSDKVSVLLRWNDTGVSLTYRASLQRLVGPFPVDAVVWVSASGKATVNDGAETRGILVKIMKEGNEVAFDSDTTTAPESTMCNASASFFFYLPANDKVIISADTGPKTNGTKKNSESSIRLDIIALAAAMYC